MQGTGSMRDVGLEYSEIHHSLSFQPSCSECLLFFIAAQHPWIPSPPNVREYPTSSIHAYLRLRLHHHFFKIPASGVQACDLSSANQRISARLPWEADSQSESTVASMAEETLNFGDSRDLWFFSQRTNHDVWKQQWLQWYLSQRRFTK